MAEARSYNVINLLNQAAYSLRDVYGDQYGEPATRAELFSYFSRLHEMLYYDLMARESDLAMTSVATKILDTVASTAKYDLGDAGNTNNVSDLWKPVQIREGDYAYVDHDKFEPRYEVYLVNSSGTQLPPLRMCAAQDLYSEQIANTTGEPKAFFLDKDYIGLLPIPDGVYNLWIPRYFANWTPLADVNQPAPFMNMFNQLFVMGVQMFARARNELNAQFEAAMSMSIQDAINQVEQGRRHLPMQGEIGSYFA